MDVALATGASLLVKHLCALPLNATGGKQVLLQDTQQLRRPDLRPPSRHC